MPREEDLSLDRYALSEFVLEETEEISVVDELVFAPPYGSIIVISPVTSAINEFPEFTPILYV